jgi:hypothetical protein
MKLIGRVSALLSTVRPEPVEGRFAKFARLLHLESVSTGSTRTDLGVVRGSKNSIYAISMRFLEQKCLKNRMDIASAY